MKAFAEDKINVTRKIEFVLGKVENGNQHFLLFPKCFQKPSFLKSGLSGKLLTFYKTKKKMEQTKFKAFADDKSNIDNMMKSVFNGIENIEEKKEKMQVTSNFSFSYNVLKRLLSQGRSNSRLCGKGLNGIGWGGRQNTCKTG